MATRRARQGGLPLVRVAAAFLLMLALNACAIPPAITIGKLAADGVLYASTGRSSTDHGLSMATGKDCATLRVLEREDVCQDIVLAQSEAVPAQIARDRVAIDSLALTVPVDATTRRAMADQAMDRAFQPHAAASRPTAAAEVVVLPRPVDPASLRVASRQTVQHNVTQVAAILPARAVPARPGLIKVAVPATKPAIVKVAAARVEAVPAPVPAEPVVVAPPPVPERAGAMERLSQILKKAFRLLPTN